MGGRRAVIFLGRVAVARTDGRECIQRRTGAVVTIATCAPSMPVELLEKISADKVSARRARPDFRQVNAVEAYLSAAEVFVENGGSPG